MTNITNNKISELDPKWASFRGFSLIFDDPTGGFSSEGDQLKLNSQINKENAKLYHALSQSLEKCNADSWKDEYSFCALPTSTYHLTVWEGINTDNIKDVKAEAKEQLLKFLKGLPKSINQANGIKSMVAESRLITKKDWTLPLAFDQLVIWNRSIMVARLKASNEYANQTLTDINHQRRGLYQKLEETTGFNAYKNYTPHISLGYFGNADLGAKASDQLPQWNEIFQKEAAGLSMMYQSISLYGFTDMVSFYRQK